MFKNLTSCFFLIVSIFGCVESFAQWVKVHETPGMIIFMDVSSLAAPADNRVVDVLTDFREPESEYDELVSMINRVEFFCEKRLRRTLSGAHYAQNMGRGQPTYEQFVPSTFKPVGDHDGWDSVMQIVCKPTSFKP